MIHLTDLQLMLRYFLYFFCFSFLSFIILFLYLLIDTKKKVASMPKVPMKLCDIHGAYPESASMWIDTLSDNKVNLRVEMCPQCYADRLRKIQKDIFK